MILQLAKLFKNRARYRARNLLVPIKTNKESKIIVSIELLYQDLI